MDLISFIFLLFIFTSLVWYIGTPLFEQSDKFLINTKNRDLKRKKENLLQQIKELELDYSIGNIDKNGYLANKEILKNQISSIIIKLKKN
tara:strand:- start:83455 stop:83724 length:270 start_codon:yes stop_codon:yes gene_type:complete